MESQEQEVQTVSTNTYAKTQIGFDSSTSPGNNHAGSGNTYYYGSCTVQDIGHIATLSVEWVEAVIWPTEVGGSSGPLVGHSGTSPYLSELGKNVSMTNLTYKGGQAP